MNARRAIRRSAKVSRSLGLIGPYGQVRARHAWSRGLKEIAHHEAQEKRLLEAARAGEAS